MIKKPSISIENRKISMDHPPYIIAEMSANHNGDIENAFKIIKEAKNASADAVKIQTYTADTITLKSNNEDFLKKMVYGLEEVYIIYTKKHTCPGIGINQFLNTLTRSA